jgi:tRNA/tmRNA/rRNA uracil-C5-methylase (TrmA/RlmC/RlmD family)
MVRLYNGDCLEFMRTLPDNSVDAVITDLPYGTTECEWDTIIPFAEMWKETTRICKGVFVTTAKQPFTSLLVVSNLKAFRYELIWNKKKVSNFANAKKQPLQAHENILVFYLGSETVYNPQKTGKASRPFGKVTCCNSPTNGNLGNNRAFEVGYPKSILDFMRPNNLVDDGGLHPAQKPTGLYRYFVETYSNPGETVLDLTMGSGTTGVACVQLGRNFIGCEISPEYFQNAKRRIEQASCQGSLFLPANNVLQPTPKGAEQNYLFN